MRLRPTFCSASGPPVADPALPAPAHLNSPATVTGGWGGRAIAEYLRAGHGNTRRGEICAGARRKSPEEAGNTRGESAEEDTLTGNCRGLAETAESDPARKFLFSATPSPTHATPNRPPRAGPRPVVNQQAGRVLRCRRGALRVPDEVSVHPLLVSGLLGPRWIKERVKHETLGVIILIKKYLLSLGQFIRSRSTCSWLGSKGNRKFGWNYTPKI